MSKLNSRRIAKQVVTPKKETSKKKIDQVNTKRPPKKKK